jgi:hypothetical protein
MPADLPAGGPLPQAGSLQEGACLETWTGARLNLHLFLEMVTPRLSLPIELVEIFPLTKHFWLIFL